MFPFDDHFRILKSDEPAEKDPQIQTEFKVAILRYVISHLGPHRSLEGLWRSGRTSRP
jgi:hypothetical protein